MVDAVHTGVLNQNVEAVDEGARSRAAVGIGLGSGGNIYTSGMMRLRVSVCRKGTLCTITEVMGRKANFLTAEYAEGAEKISRRINLKTAITTLGEGKRSRVSGKLYPELFLCALCVLCG
jgi:hypothetical protein